MCDTLISGERNYTQGDLNMDEFATNVLYYCGLYLYLGIILLVLGYFANAFLFTLCERRIHCIRKKYLRSVMRQDMAWFDTQQIGALTTKMSSGMERIKDGIGDKMGVIFGAVGTFVSGIALGFYLSWKMTLVMLITVPVLLGAMFVSGKMISRASKSETYAYSAAGGLANEVIAGIRTVMSFNAQPSEIHRYEKELKVARNLGIRKAFILAVFAGLNIFLTFAAMALSFWYGTTLVVDGSMTPGTIFGVFWAVLIATRRFGDAIPQMGVIVGAKLAVADIFAIIDRVPEIDSMNTEGLTPEEITGKITFTNIHFSYPTRPTVKILNDVSYEVNPGETVALVGHSGCGKSTMVGLLLRFYEQSAGIVALDGIPLRDYNITWLRSIIGVVQQEPVIFGATVAENIRMGDDSLTDEEIEEACRLANALGFIRKLADGFDTVIGEGAVQLSGGQKQRIAIARALVRKPQILLLDEATSALDTESEQAVQEALDLARKERTTICIAHRLSTIRDADKIIVFDEGQIAEMGTHDELMAKEDSIYASMVKAQEIAKGQEDTTLDDVEPVEMRRGVSKATSEEEERARASLARESARIRQSMISTSTHEPEWEIESAREEMAEEGAMEASLLDILKYARPELPMATVALINTILRGLTWPVFSIIYGLWQSLSYALANSFVTMNFAIAYAFGLWLISNGWSTPFTVFQVIEALNMASYSMMTAASYFPEYVRARISAGIMFTMMRKRPKIDNMSHQGEKPEIKGDLSLRNVYFSYPARKRALILQGMNLTAKHGQTVALVGASGCGKSTVIQLVERYYDALCGTVNIDNYDVRDLSIRHIREHMSLVGQEPTLFNLTIRENIMYGLDKCSKEEIEYAARLANIHEFVTTLPEGYETKVGAKGGLLSGGQKQRIAIARAIVRDPKILLLDEATSALDTESEKIVQEALDKARQGRTCLVVAHRLSTIQNADEIVVCREGRVAERGTHQTLLARKGIYYKLVERQNR
ncbi:ABC transporter, ATP-binding protein [Oesophagostomum dentatum]|uniref:ABC-type xenobiotic transporter n=1 Tax=Oesophagostomum dentatum TaxID=61180 RepID=A0A0B1TMD4_OESDE|nr:ABC transporter, ATP-binding protein [Oesophagostomum dentatum]